MTGKWQPNSLFPGAAPLAPTAKQGFLTNDAKPESDEDACPAFGYLRVLRIAFVDPPVFEVGPARLDRGIQAAVSLSSVGVVFMGLLLGPLYAAASYGTAALLH